jgi:hypothetical protein
MVISGRGGTKNFGHDTRCSDGDSEADYVEYEEPDSPFHYKCPYFYMALINPFHRTHLNLTLKHIFLFLVARSPRQGEYQIYYHVQARGDGVQSQARALHPEEN